MIDLSPIDANTGLYSASPTANFTFIGTAPFYGSGGQVRYQYDASLNETLVEADVVGNSRPDLEIRLMGDINLTAANFALTAAQSAADLVRRRGAQNFHRPLWRRGGIFLHECRARATPPYQSLYTSGDTDVADNLNLSASANQLDLYAGNLTISRGRRTESLTSGSLAFPLAHQPNETIEAGTPARKAFDFGSNFGNETIEGFHHRAPAPIPTRSSLPPRRFRTSPDMSQAQDLAAVLSHASSSTAEYDHDLPGTASCSPE